MTKEEKELLLIDLCSRLPYGPKCSITKKDVVRELKPMNNGISMPVNQVRDITVKKILNTDIINDFINDNIVLKPYLRPMSSMTNEEIKYKLSNFFNVINTNIEGIGYIPTLNTHSAIKYIDWLISNHFDTHGLIPMGLALEAKKEMYE